MNNIQFMTAINNPQQFIQNVMNNNQLMQNPMTKNALEMYQKGDSKGLETMARNLCQEKGINVDQISQQIKTLFVM